MIATDDDYRLGLLAIRNEFINLSELKHCLEAQEKAQRKMGATPTLGEVLVAERYILPQDLEYLLMVKEAEGGAVEAPVSLRRVEEEFRKNVAKLQEGHTFGRYKLLKEIGRGGMGIVLKARDEEAGRFVALKILIGGENATVRDIERFKKEATVMRTLEHKNIVRILDVTREKGLDYIAMNYIRGSSLKELVQESGPMRSDDAILVIRGSAEAVSFIHAQGIIHRDIKPDNIMLDADGTPILMDFGLAGWEKIEIVTGRGAIGTPMYQPPEQTDIGGPFGPISPASDVYGLGATLYWTLTGQHPIRGKSLKEVREKIRNVPPEQPRQLNPQVSPEAERICLRCLEKKQEARYATPKELIADIDAYLEKRGGKADASPGRKTTGTFAIEGIVPRGLGKKGTTTGARRTAERTTALRAAAGKRTDPKLSPPPAGDSPGAPRKPPSGMRKTHEQAAADLDAAATRDAHDVPWGAIVFVLALTLVLVSLFIVALTLVL